MKDLDVLDMLLTGEDCKKLPEDIAAQRACWIDTLITAETQAPVDDNGESTNWLINTIMSRAVLDVVTRNMLLTPEEPEND